MWGQPLPLKKPLKVSIHRTYIESSVSEIQTLLVKSHFFCGCWVCWTSLMRCGAQVPSGGSAAVASHHCVAQRQEGGLWQIDAPWR